jgi:hypothetical protein
MKIIIMSTLALSIIATNAFADFGRPSGNHNCKTSGACDGVNRIYEEMNAYEIDKHLSELKHFDSACGDFLTIRDKQRLDEKNGYHC